MQLIQTQPLSSENGSRWAKHKNRLFSAGLWLAAGIVAGRILGFLREALIAARFGTSAEADALTVLLTAPDFFQSILIGGALSASLIPSFQSGGGRPLVIRMLIFTLLIYGALSLVLAFFHRTIIGVLAPGLSSEARALAAAYLPVALAVIPLSALAGVTTAALQARHKFALPSFGTFFYNLVLVSAVILGGSGRAGVAWIAGGIVAAGLVRWLLQLLPALSVADVGKVGEGVDASAAVKGLPVRYVQALLAGGFLLTLPYIARAAATFAGVGGLSAFNYALKLVELPLGACLTLLSVAIFPTLSELFQANETRDDARRLAAGAIVLVLVLSVIVALASFLLRHEISALVFGRGMMSDADIGTIAGIAGIGFASLPAQALIAILAASCHANRDTLRPFLASLLGLLVFALMTCVQTSSLSQISVRLAVTYWIVAIALGCTTIYTLRLKIPLRPLLTSLAMTLVVFAPAAFALTHISPTMRLLGTGLAAAAALAGSIALAPQFRSLIRGSRA